MVRRGATPQEQAARDARLDAIAADLLINPDVTQTTLANTYGVSQQQISADIRTLKTRWQKSALSNTDERIGIQDAQYKAIIGAHLPLALQGKTRSADVVISALEKQSKLLGLDQPTKQQIGMDGTLRVEIVGVAEEDLP